MRQQHKWAWVSSNLYSLYAWDIFTCCHRSRGIMVLIGQSKHRSRDVNARETREGWPLLIVEAEVNGDSKSTKEKRGPSLVGSLGLSCR
jgi:hypothetical protein